MTTDMYGNDLEIGVRGNGDNLPLKTQWSKKALVKVRKAFSWECSFAREVRKIPSDDRHFPKKHS